MNAVEIKNLSKNFGPKQAVCGLDMTVPMGAIYGFIGEMLPLYLVFSIGSSISLIPMVYMCFHPRTKNFVLNNSEAEENTEETAEKSEAQN